MQDTIVSGTIYALHAGDGVIRYIGLTTKDPKLRLASHKVNARYYDNKRTCWVRKHSDTLEMVILEYYSDIPLEDLKKREIHNIAVGRSQGLDLVNSTDGGDGVFGLEVSEATRAKLSAASKGRKYGPYSEERRRNISEAKKGTTLSPERIEQLRQSNLGRKHTPETIARMKATHTGKPATSGMHVRWHINRGVTKDDCTFCVSGVDAVV